MNSLTRSMSVIQYNSKLNDSLLNTVNESPRFLYQTNDWKNFNVIGVK